MHEVDVRVLYDLDTDNDVATATIYRLDYDDYGGESEEYLFNFHHNYENNKSWVTQIESKVFYDLDEAKKANAWNIGELTFDILSPHDKKEHLPYRRVKKRVGDIQQTNPFGLDDPFSSEADFEEFSPFYNLAPDEIVEIEEHYYYRGSIEKEIDNKILLDVLKLEFCDRLLLLKIKLVYGSKIEEDITIEELEENEAALFY